MKANSTSFTKGRSGNPAGKAPGARHAITILAEKLMSADVEAVVESVLAAAKAGDMTAARIVMDRIAPIRKGAGIPIEMPSIVTARDVDEAMTAITDAMAAGTISPEEASVAAGVVDLRRKAIETADFDRRLREIEAMQKQGTAQ